MSITLFENIQGVGLTEEERLAFLSGAFVGDMLGMLERWVGRIRETAAGDIQATALDAPPVYQAFSGVGDIPTVQARKGYTYPYTRHTVAQAVAFDRASWLTLKLEQKVEYTMMFGLGGVQAFVQAVYDLLNDAWGVTGPDGVPLISASHPSRVGLQSNLVASTLDEDALATAERLLEGMQGPDGQRMIMRLDHLEVPTALKHTAELALGPSLSQPERGASAYARPNPVGNRGITSQSGPFLDSSTRTFGFSSMASQVDVAILDGFGPEWVMSQGGYDATLKDIGIFHVGSRGHRFIVGIGAS